MPKMKGVLLEALNTYFYAGTMTFDEFFVVVPLSIDAHRLA